jgi:hypothetical protein
VRLLSRAIRSARGPERAFPLTKSPASRKKSRHFGSIEIFQTNSNLRKQARSQRRGGYISLRHFDVKDTDELLTAIRSCRSDLEIPTIGASKAGKWPQILTCSRFPHGSCYDIRVLLQSRSKHRVVAVVVEVANPNRFPRWRSPRLFLTTGRPTREPLPRVIPLG